MKKLVAFMFFSIFSLSSLTAQAISGGDGSLASESGYCGVMAGGKIDFRRFENGERVDELRFLPYGFTSPLVFAYPQLEVASYPSFGKDSCINDFGKTIMRVEFSGEAAKKLLLAILEHNLQLTEEEQKRDLRIFTWSSAYIFARGVSCEYQKIGPPSGGKYFYCVLNVLEDFQSTAGGSLALPKPRMGAGNARQVLEMINE